MSKELVNGIRMTKCSGKLLNVSIGSRITTLNKHVKSCLRLQLVVDETNYSSFDQNANKAKVGKMVIMH